MIPGDINFIGATSTNNGLTARIGNSECLHPAGTITVTYNGSVGEAFYQSEPFWASDDVNVLYPKFMMTKQSALFFLTPLIKKGKGYGYSFKWTKEKMEQDRIVLPVNNKGEIDFTYIEERVRELEEERVRELEAYLQEAGFEDCTLTKEEDVALKAIECGKKQMRKFYIVKKFHVDNSHNILKSDVVFGSGTTPYVTASEGNNSIVSYIFYKPGMMERGNSIMIGGKTLVITYQPRDFFSNDSHNLVLTVNDESGRNESAQLYMVAALYKTLSPKYSWGDSISKTKIQKDVVYLPVNIDGKTVDYSFMETYISAIKKQCIARLKQEIDMERKAYNKVLETQNQESLGTKTTMMELPFIDEQEIVEAAEDYECYQLKDDNQKIIDYIGDDKTILLGCYKNKKHLKWIQEHRIYNIRLGKRKGSMSNELELFEKTTLLILYDVYHPNKQIVYKIESCCEMSGQQLKGLGYPNQNAGKTYMTFKLSTLAIHSDHLKELGLIEKIINDHPNHMKGTPVFVEPKKTI